MALEIGQVAGGFGVFPVRRAQGPGDEAAAIETDLAAPPEQAAPLTGVAGIRPLSGQAIQALQGADPGAKSGQDGTRQDGATQGDATQGGDDGRPGGELSPEEEKVVRELKKRDQEVRRHEAAHAAAGGQYAGAPTFTYQQGPDGQRYAVGGEVSIDTSPGRTPEETARKADQIRAAALAPADPSGQDRAVAAAAAKMKLDAQAEAAKQRQEEFEARQAEDKTAPALPGQEKPEGGQPEIVGPKPPGQTDAEARAPDGARSAAEPADQPAGDGRLAAVANAYSRADASVSRPSRAAANALSLVA